MFATLRQQFAPRLLAQVLQHVQLLIELLGAAASSGLGYFFQPLATMASVVNIPAGTGDRPAAIQSFQSIHHTGEIFDHGEITSGQLAQHAYPGFTMVDRLEIMEAQPLGEFASIDLVTLVALFEQWDLARIAEQNLGNMRLEQVVEPGCPGASSKVTNRLPRRPAKNSRIVDALVSRMDSIMTLPWESITATEIVA